MGISVVNKQKPDVLPHLRLPPNSTLIHPSFPLAENVTVIFAAIISPEAKSVGSEELPSWLHTFPGGFHGRWCWSHKRQRLIPLTSLLRMQWTMTMTNPSKESKTAKRIWKSAERRSVMARTADIQVRASRGSTTQELHRDALSRERDRELSSTSPFSSWDSNPASPPPRSRRAVEDFSSQRLCVGDLSWAPLPGEQEEALHTHTAQTRGGTTSQKVQSCIKLEVGRKDADPSLLPPSRAAPHPPPRLFPRKGNKIQSLQVVRGKGNSCSRDWSVTMAVSTRVTDIWTSTAHGRHQHWDVSRFRVTQTDRQRADVQTEIFVLLLYSTPDGPHNTENYEPDLTSLGSGNLLLSCAISPDDALEKKQSFLFHVWQFLWVSLFLCGH